MNSLSLCQQKDVSELAASEVIVAFSQFDVEKPLVTTSQLEEILPQRYEMAQLDAIVYEDRENLTYVGYKDATSDQFWVRGHMPNMPLMPGVIMTECAAQLTTYIAIRNQFVESAIGLAGIDKVRVRQPVVPGDRLIMMVRVRKVRKNAFCIAEFQGYVNEKMAIEGEIRGVALPKIKLPNS